MNNPRDFHPRVCTLICLLLGIGNSEVSAFVPSRIAHQIDRISSGRHGACSHPAVVFKREQSEHVAGRYSWRTDAPYQKKLVLASKKAGLQENSHHRPEKSKRSTKHVSPHQSRGAFNALLDKLAKEESAQTAERAENMLFDRLRSAALDDLTADGTNASDLPYDVLSFNIVLNAWSKALNAPRAETLLGRMVHMHEKGILPFGPNEVSYSTVADAWKRMPGDDTENNVEEARVLDLMHEMDDDDKAWPSAADLKEDLVSFNQELDLFAREGFPEAAETAEMMLFDSIREAATASDESKHIGCDIISFNTVLNCWAKLGNPQRADALLSRLEHLSDIGVLPFGPNSVSFATVISSWANSKLKRAPYECEALLDKVEGLCDEDGDEHVSNVAEITPTIHMYAATITAWSRSKRSDAAHRAEQVLGRLERLYKAKKGKMLKPNSVLYTAIIQCWGRSKDADALDRAEAIFQRMKGSGDPDIMPTEHTYSALLNAYSYSGLGPKSAERADELLLEVEEADNLNANVYIFTNAIKTWARSGHVKAGERAEEILKSMIASGDPVVRPNIYTFTAALDAMITAKDEHSFDADSFLEMMKSAEVNPDKVLQGKVTKALKEQGK